MRFSWPKATLALAATATALAVGAGEANAQWGGIGSYTPPKTSRNPTISPYLNLSRGGDPAINYYGLVRPQMDANRNFQNIEQGTFIDPRLGPSQMGVAPDGTPLIGSQNYLPNQAAGLMSGHPATYFYYSHYYQFPNRVGGTSNAAGGSFGRPGMSQSTPFFTGSNGIVMPVNPAGPNPMGGFGPFGSGAFSGGQIQAPGMVTMP